MWKHTIPIDRRHNRRVRVERTGASLVVMAGYIEPLDGHPRVGLIVDDRDHEFLVDQDRPAWVQVRSAMVPRAEVRRDGGVLAITAQYRSSARGPAIDLLFDDDAGDFRFVPERDDAEPGVGKLTARAEIFPTV